MEQLDLPRFDPPLRVLAVDDEEFNRELVRSFLTPFDIQVIVAGNGEEALARLAEHHPDLVLLDVMMPGMTGFEVCRQIKQEEQTRVIPVLLISALKDRGDRIRGIQAGADEFLTKPVDRIELVVRVHALGKVKRANENLENAHHVVLSLARAVEAKDTTTGNHCDRLIRLCSLFCEHLGLDGRARHPLELASVLHDVGKIGIPDAILLKPGSLTEAEWEVMRRHPVLGEEICKPLRSFQEVLPVIRHHHERWNGRGYPDGLAGDEIPLLARVFQLVDAFDAMTSRRSYKPAFSVAETLATLTAEAERGFWDRGLLEAFRDCLATIPNLAGLLNDRTTPVPAS